MSSSRLTRIPSSYFLGHIDPVSECRLPDFERSETVLDYSVLAEMVLKTCPRRPCAGRPCQQKSSQKKKP